MGLLYSIYQSLNENNDRLTEEDPSMTASLQEPHISLISLLINPIRDERTERLANKPFSK